VRSSRRICGAAWEEVGVRKLKVSTFVTLDGVMQAPGGPDEDRSGGFTHGGWSVGYWDDQMGRIMGEFMAPPFELLLGRRTYEIFAAYWPHSTEPGADALNSARKHVASRTLRSVVWNNSTLIKGDVATYVSELKQQSGPEIQVHGSGDLLQTLLKNELVDEFHVWTFPVVLGAGRRLFGEGAIPAGLEVEAVTTSTTGVVIATYERVGAIKYGSFALEDPSDAAMERREGLPAG
jgi:dihydrofolate reductase